MTSADTTGKVTAARLRRDAYLYIRQSTLYQVANNTESTARQYDLAGRAVALGWPTEKIHVIDIDQGHSGASAAPGSSWAWNAPGWPATTPTGTGCCRSAPTTTP